MSDNLLDEMIEAQNSKSPLIQEILLGLSTYENIYVFEGKDDFPVYDEWMKRNDVYNESCHIIAKGKKQIIDTYHYGLNSNNQEIKEHCMFFIDHDYDLTHYKDKNILTLNCYSIENHIATIDFVGNYLKDEFELDARRTKERDELLNIFKKDFQCYFEILTELCFPLFANYNCSINTPYYEDMKKIVDINVGNVSLKANATKIGIDPTIPRQRVSDLRLIYDGFKPERKIRGKYVFEFIKKWLESARIYILGKYGLKVKKDPMQITFRRMACSSKVPNEMMNYI